MTVVDASVVVEYLVGAADVADRVRSVFAAAATDVAAPHLLDAEVGQVLRRLTRAGRVEEERARGALDDLRALRVTRFPHGPLLQRAFALRDNFTIYDGLYVALAESLGAELITRDARLSRAPGCRARVRVL